MLADRFDGLLESLDTVVEKAITALEESAERGSRPSANGDLESVETTHESVVQKLDESVFKLHIWASDLAYQDFTSNPESLAMRDMNAHDILQVLEFCKRSVVEDLHKIFNQMEINIHTLSESSQSMFKNDRKDWYASRDCLFSNGGRQICAYILQGLHTIKL